MIAAPVEGQGWLRLTGADRADFLHGQVSNDVRGLQVGEQNRSLLLNHKGHALAEMRVMRSADSFDVLVEGGAAELVERNLRAHIIFDQVELFVPTEPRTTLTVQGKNAAELLEQVLGVTAPREGSFLDVSVGLTLIPSRRSGWGGYDLVVAPDAAPALLDELASAGAIAVGKTALELARICAGRAAAATEAGEGILPQEAGLEPLVSYRKGCYLGQEIMARIEARGKLRRQLAALVLEDVPAAGSRDVLQSGKVVGRLGGVAGHPEIGIVALAVLRSNLSEDALLEVGKVLARPVELPLDQSLGPPQPVG